MIDEGDFPRTIREAAKKIVAAGGECYFLPLQFFQFRSNAPGISADNVVQMATIIATIIGAAGISFTDRIYSRTLRGILAGSVIAAAPIIMYYAKEILDSGFVLDLTARSGSQS